jgi:hypothetical protein
VPAGDRSFDGVIIDLGWFMGARRFQIQYRYFKR